VGLDAESVTWTCRPSSSYTYLVSWPSGSVAVTTCPAGSKVYFQVLPLRSWWLVTFPVAS